MSFGFIVTTALEILAGGFIIWGFFHEEKFVELEDKIWRSIKSRHQRRQFIALGQVPKTERRTKSCS